MVFEIATNINTTISIRDLTIRPNEKAIIKYYYRDGVELSKGTLILEGNAYKNWGNDDTYLIAWIVKNVCGSNVEAVDASGAVIEVVMKEPIVVGSSQTANISSAISVHNDNDVAKINDLETQLATLQTKMASMLQIMISKGLV